MSLLGRLELGWEAENLTNADDRLARHLRTPKCDAGNVSVFWLFDFGTTGANFVTLDDPTGWSNATLYTTGSPPGVPEPATWAMMLLGFGAAGTALRRSRRRTTALAQIA